jgi:hypothetical protein
MELGLKLEQGSRCIHLGEVGASRGSCWVFKVLLRVAAEPGGHSVGLLGVLYAAEGLEVIHTCKVAGLILGEAIKQNSIEPALRSDC